ncbi:MAG: hypothetical protein V7724_17940 [Sediminicola sp.]
MIFLQDGIGYGTFTIDSSYTGKDYYIESHTTWMKNFPVLKPYIQEFQVFQEGIVHDPTRKLSNDIVIDIYPEGGKLVKDVNNTIGFQVSGHSWKDVSIENITLVDEMGHVLKDNLVVNDHGMGKVTFFMEADRHYSLKVKLKNGVYVAQELPMAETLGMVLRMNSIDPDKIYGEIETNSKTLNEIHQKPIYIAVHKNGEISVQELMIKSALNSFIMKKSQLPYGVNAITVFDSSYRPILGRLFFNGYGAEKTIADINLTYEMNESKDSLNIDLTLTDPYEGSMSLSISALPFETISYAPDNSLISSFLLRPYLGIEGAQPTDYIAKWNRKSLFDLDILLLIQGWGTYNWDQIFNGPSKYKYAFESGVDVRGKILDADLKREEFVWGYTNGLGAPLILPIEPDKKFQGNAILFKGDSLRISVLDAKRSLRKPKAEIEFVNIGDKDSPTGIQVKPSERKSFTKTDGMPIIMPNVLQKRPQPEKTIFLDEVVVTDQKLKDLRINSAVNSGRIITDDDIKRRVTVVNYLSTLGYRIKISEGRVTVLSRTPPPSSIALRVPVPVIIGGLVSDGTDLLSMPLSRVQSIVYDNAGYGFISLNLRSGHYILEKKERYISFLIENGFSRPEEYYNPGYVDHFHSTFRNYGALDWHSQVILNKNRPTTIKIPVMDQNEILLYIEGMGSDGKLISTSKRIHVLAD